MRLSRTTRRTLRRSSSGHDGGREGRTAVAAAAFDAAHRPAGAGRRWAATNDAGHSESDQVCEKYAQLVSLTSLRTAGNVATAPTPVAVAAVAVAWPPPQEEGRSEMIMSTHTVALKRNGTSAFTVQLHQQ